MKPSLLLLVVWGLLVSCSHLPQMTPDGQVPPKTQETDCRALFPEGNWQLTHAIEAALPGNRKGFMMGVTVLSSASRSVKVVIMTLEGFVVFEARHDGRTSIDRAVSPFDSDAFARGLMADIHLIFFKPLADRTIAGSYHDGTPGCRYLLADGTVVDMANLRNNRWQTRLYQANHRLVRTVNRVYGREKNGIAAKIELTAHGHPGYELTMDLVEAIPLGKE